MSDDLGNFITPELELRRMAATMRWGSHAKALVHVAQGDVEPGDAFDGHSLREQVDNMPLEDLKDTYCMLLEAVVMDGDLLTGFFVGRPTADTPLRQRLGDHREAIQPMVVKPEEDDSDEAILGAEEVLRATIDRAGNMQVRARHQLPHYEVKRLLLEIGRMAADIAPADDND